MPRDAAGVSDGPSFYQTARLTLPLVSSHTPAPFRFREYVQSPFCFFLIGD